MDVQVKEKEEQEEKLQRKLAEAEKSVKTDDDWLSLEELKEENAEIKVFIEEMVRIEPSFFVVFVPIGCTLMERLEVVPLEWFLWFWNDPNRKTTLLGRFYFWRDEMKIGYVRVSTAEQNTGRQEVLMEELGVDKIYIDKCSGANAQRPELKEMLSFVRNGDVVIVESISRFARNTKDLLELVEVLSSKEVIFISKKEAIDTNTPTGKFMLTVFGAMYELERENILDRQREGIELAKKQGKYTGRKRIERDNFDSVYDRWKRKEITAVQAMKVLNLSKSTFYRRVAESEQDIEI